MINWIKQLSNWVLRIASWLWTAHRAFLAVIAIPVVFLICWALFPSWESRVRISGMCFELLGLITVVVGLYYTRKLFGRPGFLIIVRDWLKRFPRFKIDTHIYKGSGGIKFGGAAVTALGTVSVSPSASLEKRVAVLEKGLENANRLINAIQQKVVEEARNHSSDLESERRERETGDESNQKLLQEVAVGGLYLEVTGVFWLLFGIFLATASNEIVGFFIAN